MDVSKNRRKTPKSSIKIVLNRVTLWMNSPGLAIIVHLIFQKKMNWHWPYLEVPFPNAFIHKRNVDVLCHHVNHRIKWWIISNLQGSPQTFRVHPKNFMGSPESELWTLETPSHRRLSPLLGLKWRHRSVVFCCKKINNKHNFSISTLI